MKRFFQEQTGTVNMPRGVSNDAQRLHEILEKGVMLKAERVEGSVNLNDEDPVFVGIIADVDGYGPHVAAMYLDQNRFHASADTALQGADEILRDWKLEHYPEDFTEKEAEYGDEAMDVFTETFDGWAFKVSPQEFAEAVRGTHAEQLVDIEPLEDEEEEEGSVEDPDYVIQGAYPDGRISDTFGYDDEATAIREAQKLLRDPMFEGETVRVITRDGELVWSSEGENEGLDESRGARRAPAPNSENLDRLASYIAHAVMYDHSTAPRDLVAAYHLTPQEAQAVLAQQAGWFGPGGRGVGAFITHIKKTLKRKEWFEAPDPKLIPGAARAYGRYAWLLEHAEPKNTDQGRKDQSDIEDLQRELTNVGFNGWGLYIDNWPDAQRAYNAAETVYRRGRTGRSHGRQ